ncbi:MAG: TetR/AcrR family transcriptional regulator [Kofleriaceae bacterium]
MGRLLLRTAAPGNRRAGRGACSRCELYTLSSRCQHEALTPSKAPYHHGDLRNALVDAGLRFIEQVGAEAFSLREVAREVGVSANAAYRHFEDKGALLTAIAVSGFDRLSSEMQKAMLAARPRGAMQSRAVARFNAAARAYVDLAQEHPQLYGLMFGSAGRACLAAEGTLVGPTPGALLGRVLDELVEEKVMSKKHRVGAEIHVWSAVHGFASLAHSGPLAELSPNARADALTELLRFVIAGLRG